MGACLKDDPESSKFAPADIYFLNSVASDVAMNLQGSGATLKRILTRSKHQHVRSVEESDLMQQDFNKEVGAIIEAVVNLVHKGGGEVNQAAIRDRVYWA